MENTNLYRRPKYLHDFMKDGKSLEDAEIELKAYQDELAEQKERIEKKLAERDARVQQRKEKYGSQIIN